MLEIHDAVAIMRFLRFSRYQKYMALEKIMQWCHIVRKPYHDHGNTIPLMK
jgi:hypothetical protein